MPSVVAAATEPSWHRNLRARRQRARRVCRLAKGGAFIDRTKLSAARLLLSGHHGTRGAASAVMARTGNDDVWHRVGKNGKPTPVPHVDSWRCDKCTRDCRLVGDLMPYFVRPNRTCCNRCNGSRPTKVTTFKETKIGKNTAAAANGGKAATVGGGVAGGGGGGGAKNDKEKKLQKEIDELKKANKQLREEREAAQDEDDEVDDGMEADEPSAPCTVEDWQDELKQTERDLKVSERNAKEAPKNARYPQEVIMLKECISSLKKKISDSKDPHEQLVQKNERSKKLRRWQQELM